MKGYQVTFFTGESRRHGHVPMGRWLVEAVQSLGIRGATLNTGVQGIGRDGKLHSAHFFDLADQPVEVMVVVSEADGERLFSLLEREEANVFYVKTPVEFGVVGAPKA
ncbi:DUF190 domain-containing protein [Caldimonas caldifontis]|uniref:Uncharacterized protein n=1 Tax=Caldimonas caldifontis TaxID=1452508 RepID=A0A2S5SUK6_9BURK|nr:DUF190 domain-containing protein [Caldimonas caldifontis]PPE66402.1 hypothetical protein C1704_08780 [Caldimonas caldifontis]